MFRFANYVFGGDNESNVNNENIDVNHCTERDVDDDWILIDPFDDNHYKKPINAFNESIDANDGNGHELQIFAANYETTTDRVPQTSDISDAQQPQQSIDKSSVCEGTDAADSPSLAGPPGMEESWFVTPPPCFNSLSNPVIIETTPLENLLIEHPSMSVFGPSLPPIDQRSPHSDQTLTPSPPTDTSSSDTTVQTQSRRQMRQLRRQQQQQH
ncbi:unnamed protein product, partial [Oppiella nova]